MTAVDKPKVQTNPPGAPGVTPRWTSSAKIGIGTAMSGDSNVWFTISHGILNEVFFPRVDIANIRDMELIVTDGRSFFSEEKRDCVHEYKTLADGVPAYRLTNTCKQGRYRITKTIICDPRRNVLLQNIEFEALKGKLEDYRLFALMSPHVNKEGTDNNGWVGDFKGIPMLFAERGDITVGLGCSVPFKAMTCGYVGENDAWHDLKSHFQLTELYSRVDKGNIALAAEIDLTGSNGSFLLGLGFGFNAGEAGIQIRTSLTRDFGWAMRDYIAQWEEVQSQFDDLTHSDKELGALYRTSLQVLKTHEGKHFSGSVIASLAIPWGESRSDTNVGGYHLIWPRDQVETAFAFLAAGDLESAREVLHFLICTQEKDGHWMQCMWGDGSAYWEGLQMDETALPILLADQLVSHRFLQGIDPWPMVEKATRFLVMNGPYTQQGRWEEDAGYNAYTIATEVAALLAASDFFDRNHKHSEAQFLRETADWWNERIEEWIYVQNTALAKQIGVDGYYVRAAPKGLFDGTVNPSHDLWIANRPKGEDIYPYEDIVCIDALALVRFGLRAADDPCIVNTIRVIDETLKTETTKGPIWHRYNEDGYGEHNDGRPFDGTGHGRGWPLLTGERAHYALAGGNLDEARELCKNMIHFAGEGGLLPEQIWDSADIPERSLFNGHSAGSAKPLTWAHSEYISLLRSIRDGKVFGMPQQTYNRYIRDKQKAEVAIWHKDDRICVVRKGQTLRIQALKPFTLFWGTTKEPSEHESQSVDSQLGIFYVGIPTGELPVDSEIFFNFGDGQKFTVKVIK